MQVVERCTTGIVERRINGRRRGTRIENFMETAALSSRVQDEWLVRRGAEK